MKKFNKQIFKGKKKTNNLINNLQLNKIKIKKRNKIIRKIFYIKNQIKFNKFYINQQIN